MKAQAAAVEILVINPGSTSTKVALFRAAEETWHVEVDHEPQELGRDPSIAAQLPLRLRAIAQVTASHGLHLETLGATVGRGGLLRPLPGGTYRVDPAMAAELLASPHGLHAANLGAPLALEFAKRARCPAFVVDPVVTDELLPVARETGFPGLSRRSLFHALNQRAMAQRAARELGRPYVEMRLIVAHLGGGITVGLHEGGEVIEVNNGLDGDGPMAPERSGALPLYALWRASLAGKLEIEETLEKISGRGGLVDLAGTPDLRRIARDARGRLLRAALALGVAREIGRRAAVHGWPVDALVLTGGLAHDRGLVRAILRRASFAAQKVRVYPGEREMEALAMGALRVLTGAERALDYAHTHA